MGGCCSQPTVQAQSFGKLPDGNDGGTPRQSATTTGGSPATTTPAAPSPAQTYQPTTTQPQPIQPLSARLGATVNNSVESTTTAAAAMAGSVVSSLGGIAGALRKDKGEDKLGDKSPMKAAPAEPASLGPPTVQLPLQGFSNMPIHPAARNVVPNEYSFMWQRAGQNETSWQDVGSAKTTPQPYTPAIDDVNYNLRIKITPIAGGGRALPTFSNITTVSIEQATLTSLLNSVGSGTATFALTEQDATGKYVDWQITLDNTAFTFSQRKKRGGEFKKVEAVKWSAGVNILSSPVDDRSFTIQYDKKGHTMRTVTESREFFIIAFRTYHALGQSDVVQEICGAEFARKWLKGGPKKMSRAAFEQSLQQGGAEFPAKNLSRGYDIARNTLIAVKLALLQHRSG